jgi:site-specific recombinase XerD
MATIPIGPNCSIYLRGKKNNLWYARFYDKEKHPAQKSVPLGTNNQTDATGKAYQLYNDWRRDLYDPWQDIDFFTTIEEAVEHFRKERSSEVPTWKDNVWVFNRVAKLNSRTHVRGITPQCIRRVVHDPTLSEATRHSYFNKLHAIMVWFTHKGYYDKNPMDDVAKPEKPDRLPKYYSGDQVIELLQNASFLLDMNAEHTHRPQEYKRWFIDAFELVAFTGLRKKETPLLTWGDIVFPTEAAPIGSIIIRASKKKRDRVITMLPHTEKLLRRLEAETRISSHEYEPVLKNDTGAASISGDYLSRKFTQTQQFAKMKAIGLHGLRHTFCVLLVMKGVHVVAVQKQMGHKNIETTMRYAALSQDDILRITYEKFL